MFRLLMIVALAALPGLGRAQCSGTLIDDRLSPAERAELAEAVAATSHAEGLLWQAERDGHRITLLGTFHLSDPRNQAILDRVQPLIAQADKVLVEITTEGEAELQAHLGAHTDLLLLPENATLVEVLPPEVWNGIAKAAQARSIPAVMAARMQPWYLTMTLAVPPCAMTSLVAGERGVDAGVLALAEDAGVPVGAVEDWRTALDLLMSGSFDEQVQMLELVLMEPELQAEAMASMIDHYFKGEVAAIWELSRITTRWLPGITPEEAAAVFDTFDTRLLADRNTAWMPVILSEAAAHPALFVAVGAAHLPGRAGLLAELETAGWRVTRLD